MYCKATTPLGKNIYFELTAAQTYGDPTALILIHWEEDGRVFVDSMPLDILLTLIIQEEN